MDEELNIIQKVGVVPKIVDVEWKLEVMTNMGGTDSDNLLYTVVLKTDNGENIDFKCGSQQLQDLVYKLKNLVRHCENVGTNNS